MIRWLQPEKLFDGRALHDNLYLSLEDGKVVGCRPRSELGDVVPQSLAGTVAPGFVDLQVNGGGGVLLNGDPSPDGLARIAEAHRALGTVAILPTLITDTPDTLDRAVEAVLASDAPGILGLHIEGPHINAARRGTHAAAHIRPFDQGTLRQVEALRAAGKTVMITVAPEVVSARDIRALADTGAIVSLGHSDATAEEARAGLGAGARAVTHLFNAMSQMQGRAPGLAGAAINSDVHVGMICDGHHVSDEMLALAIRARPVPDRTFLVSDAMATVGGPDRFELYGKTIHLQGGRLVNDEGALAGAHLSQAEGVARLIRSLGIDPETALAMASRIPAELVGRADLATLEGRPAADLIVLGPDWDVRGSLADELDR